MSFEFRPAVRTDTHLLLSIAGGTGSGKTESALRLATGLAGGQRFCVIDTEAGRALHKADDYEFDHGDLTAPFTPERYGEALKAADARGYPVIVIDSASHEYESEGGILDIQQEEWDRLMRGDESRREATRMASWIAPKQRHKRAFVHELLQARAHVILCFRAEDKIEIVKQGGKTVVRPKESLVGANGWVPICERRLPFEMTMSFLVLQDRPGVPVPIKLETRHASFVPLDAPLSEDVGKALAEWAAGGQPKPGAEPNEPLVTELLAVCAELGVDHRALIEKHRADSKWLTKQLATAKTNLEAKRAAEASGEPGATATGGAGGASDDPPDAAPSSPDDGQESMFSGYAERAREIDERRAAQRA